MLLRNTSPNGEADQDIYLNMTSSASLQTGQQDQEDIVAIPARTNTEQSIYHTGHNEISTSSDMNDDVWGDDDDDSSSQPTGLAHQQISNPQAGQRSVDVSDIPRLKQEHTTAGYRDGVTIAKAASVQAGFDEGYGLGATIGAQAGRLLGLLQGLVGALSSASGSGSGAKDGKQENENARLQALLETATKELNVLSIFGEDYFARDGIWKYEVSKVPKKDEGKNGAVDGKTASLTGAEEQHPQLPTSREETAETGKGEEPKEEETIVFADIAASHPLLRKWDGILQQEAERYGLVWDVLLPEEDQHDHQEEEEGVKSASGQKDHDKNNGEKDDGKSGRKPLPVRQNKGALAW
ncbi:hypothetical protein V8F33_007188 [Rhypophila sp. PSN 637]